jgi:hypothetical protein
MSEQAIIDYARERGFHQQTLERWLKLAERDRAALLDLAQGLKMGGGHFRDFLDWLEEISLRDGVGFCEILRRESILRVSSDPRLGRNDKLKRVKDEIKRFRFPRLAQIEGEIQGIIRELKLQPQIQFSVPSGLEGGTLSVQLRATSHEQLRRLTAELEALLEKKAMKEIFDLLTGKKEDAGFSA